MLRAELVTQDKQRILYPDTLSIGCKRGGDDLVVVYRKDGEVGTDTYNRRDIFRYTTRVVPDNFGQETTDEEEPNDESGDL